MVEPHDKSHARRDRLVELEEEIQKLWADKKLYEAEVDPSRKKFFLNFPYPYVNGKLHVGHAYSMSKCEFTIRYKRLKGYNTLWPFSFHCTGMPISAAAEKLKREMEEHGDNVGKWADDIEAEFRKQVEAYKKDPKKNKVTVKLPQYTIMRMNGIADKDMDAFKADTNWLHYFPPIAQEDLKRLGLMVDWRRSFITTDINPYYDSFIQWQLNQLKQKNKISFGKRPTVYSTIDKQPCADHDRSEGEGGVPQEYTLVKLRCLELPEKLAHLKGRDVFLVAATLRPETMFGQTNCFVLPTGQYGCFEMKNNEVFIAAERSARFMAYQGLTKEAEKWESLGNVLGEDLIGIPLKAPLCPFEKVYALPMLTISMEKGTGIVTSVPSDSPDDYATIRDLKNKPALREKFKVKDEWILPYEPVPIIDIPGYGNLCAIKACDDFKVTSQNDKGPLAEAKEFVYNKGFYEGVFTVEKYKGQKVSEAKNTIRDQMIADKEALIYYEPDKKIVSRSGDVCVITFCDQWFIAYGEESWKNKLHEHVNSSNFNSYLEANHKALNEAIDWLKEWGVSRSFGLGTRIPWDKQYLVESLSDSTIYMAYYTVAHLLQGDIKGHTVGSLGIKAEDLTAEVWNYIFFNIEYKECPVPKEKLDQLKAQFRYFYPWDLRCSAKDLIRNHLTMSLYNHAAIWEDEPQLWPRAIWCNGWLMVNGEKMAKSQGNFLTIEDCLKKFGADATRIAVADAGDTLDDANFVIDLADNAVLRLWQLEQWIKSHADTFSTLRKPDEIPNDTVKFYDNVFVSLLDRTLMWVDKAYDAMRNRDVLKYGFFDLLTMKEDYKAHCGDNNMRQDVFLKYIEVQCLAMYPTAPHFCDMVWRTYYLPNLPAGHGKPEFLANYSWPDVDPTHIDFSAIRAYDYLKAFNRNARLAFDKFNSKRKDKTAPVNKLIVAYAPEYYDWQKTVLQVLSSCNITDKNEIFDDWKKKFTDDKALSKDIMKKSLQFGAYLINEMKSVGREVLDMTLPYNEKELISNNLDVLKKEFGTVEIELIDADTAKESKNKIIAQSYNNLLPGKPQVIFE